MAQTVASCTNGTATVTGVSGGVSPYNYLWSNGTTIAANTGLSLGSYWVSITDASGCADTAHVYINQTPVITVNTTIAPPTCLDTNGSITAFGSGGTSPYTYLWSNGATTQWLGGLGASYLGITATDANGCVGVDAAYLSSSSPITITYATTPSSCTAPTGTATLTMTGGTSPYTVQWFTSPPQTGPTASGLPAGYYTFKVTDNVGCVQTGSVYIPPVAIIAPGLGVTPATCTSATGALSATPTGGTSPYSYSWSTGSSAASISGLVAGSYSLTVTDVNGCKVVKYPYVPVYSPLTLHFATTPASCLFTADGSITASTTGGTAAYTYTWNTGATGATLSGRKEGLYWVSVADAAGCTAYDTITLGYNHTSDFCYCTIEGKIYFDMNGNCTRETAEPGIEHIQMHCSGYGYTYSDASGYYSFKVPTGSYTISQNILAYYPLSACQSNSISVAVTAASGCTHTVNFADTINPIHDIHISTWDFNYAVPGNTYTQKTIITNDGTQNETSILAGYKADGQLFSPSFVPSGTFSGGTSYWYTSGSAFPTLAPGASTTYNMTYNVPTDIPIGTSVLFKDTVAYTSPMTNWLSDYSPWNNTNYFSTNVVASYDPNFKEVSPKGYGPTGVITYHDSVLEYMVHFQNTGTWYAQNIIVLDTLDPNLDWTTLKPVYSSHPCRVTVSETGVASFNFKDIHLDPQGFDDLRSNGMFTYTIKTRHGLNIGTQIRNCAAIYFDYNKPIYTNKTLNTLGWALTVPDASAGATGNSFTLFPNPANNTFNVTIDNEKEDVYAMRVTDITGKTMISKNITLQTGKQTFSVDAGNLASGVYLVTIAGADKMQTQKLVIMK